jgi:hypothetical protein
VPPQLGQPAGLTIWPHTPAEEGSVQGLRSEEGYLQDGDGSLPRRDLGVECSLTGCSVRDLVSPHLVAEHRCYRPRVPEDGRGSGQ